MAQSPLFIYLSQQFYKSIISEKYGESMMKNKTAGVLMVLLVLFALGHSAEKLVLVEYFTNAG